MALIQIKGKMTHGLHGIAMEKSIGIVHHFTHGLDIDHVANFVVGVHQTNQSMGFLLE